MSYFPGYTGATNDDGRSSGQYASPQRPQSHEQQRLQHARGPRPVGVSSGHASNGSNAQDYQVTAVVPQVAYQQQNAWPQANAQYYAQQNQQHAAYMPSNAPDVAHNLYATSAAQNTYQHQNDQSFVQWQAQPPYENRQQMYMPGRHPRSDAQQISQSMRYDPQYGPSASRQVAQAPYDHRAQLEWQNGQLDGAASSSQQPVRQESYQSPVISHQAQSVHQSPIQHNPRGPQQPQPPYAKPQRSSSQSSPRQQVHGNVQQHPQQFHDSPYQPQVHHRSPEQAKHRSLDQQQRQSMALQNVQPQSFVQKSPAQPTIHRAPSQVQPHVQTMATPSLSYHSTPHVASDAVVRSSSIQSQHHTSDIQVKQSPAAHAISTPIMKQNDSVTPLTTISPAQLHPHGLASMHRQPASTYSAPNTISPALLQRAQPNQAKTSSSSIKTIRHDDHSDSVKRRKSNDGAAVPSHATVLQPQSINKQHGAHRVNSSSSSIVKESQFSQPTPRSNIDLKGVMYALADEYLSAARKLKSSSKDDTNHDYERLTSTALGCLESILQNFRFAEAREEAQLRLRIATLIFEETTNLDKAEEVLIKGYTLCDQANLVNCKYAMQHLLIRISHTRNPKAARKSVDKIITEVEKLRITSWTYIFRVLGATCALASHELSTANRHVTAVLQMAEHRSNNAVRIFALCLEIAIHFMNGTGDGYELAQRSIASLQSFQMDSTLQAIPQLRSMVGCFTTSSSMMAFSAEAMVLAMQHMQKENEAASKIKTWNDEGSFLLPLGKKAVPDLEADTGGLVTSDSRGELSLRTFWLNKSDLFTLSYVISAIACLPRNGEQRTAEAFLGEAAKISQTRINTIGGHGIAADHTARRVQNLQVNLSIMLASALAGRAQYASALKQLRTLKENDKKFQPSQSQKSRIRLITAMCEQGLGHLQEAYKLYLPDLDVSNAEKLPAELRDIRTLAVLSSIHVLKTLSPDDKQRPDELLENIEEYCLSHPNRCFASAYYVVKATIAPKDTLVIKTKDSLNNALSPAQATKNKQLLSIIMNTMTQLFFTDIIGKQAGNASNAGRTLANHSGDSLWVAIGCGMLRNTNDLAGRFEDAAMANKKAMDAIEQIPADVKEELKLGMSND